MKTSDKELDELFSAKLNNLETEPDAATWNNIAAKLEEKPKTKSIIPALRIAAGVLVVLSVGLLLLRENEQPAKNNLPKKVAKVELQQEKPTINADKNVAEKKDILLLTSQNKAVQEVHADKRVSSKTILQLPKYSKTDLKMADEILAQTHQQPEKNDNGLTDRTVLASVAVVPDASTSLIIKSDEETLRFTPVKTQNLVPKTSTPVVASKRKGIRSMGDLVNLVMAKVDKRPDKLIEFTDNDDGDESNITGINLGIISIKKEK
jgi:hypothetical protein